MKTFTNYLKLNYGMVKKEVQGMACLSVLMVFSAFLYINPPLTLLAFGISVVVTFKSATKLIDKSLIGDGATLYNQLPVPAGVIVATKTLLLTAIVAMAIFVFQLGSLYAAVALDVDFIFIGKPSYFVDATDYWISMRDASLGEILLAILAKISRAYFIVSTFFAAYIIGFYGDSKNGSGRAFMGFLVAGAYVLINTKVFEAIVKAIPQEGILVLANCIDMVISLTMGLVASMILKWYLEERYVE